MKNRTLKFGAIDWLDYALKTDVKIKVVDYIGCLLNGTDHATATAYGVFVSLEWSNTDELNLSVAGENSYNKKVELLVERLKECYDVVEVFTKNGTHSKIDMTRVVIEAYTM